MSDSAVAVTGLGMVSALGHDVVTSCAAARAGISRAAELPLKVWDAREFEEVGVVGHPVTGITDGFEGFGRVTRLASAGLLDLITGSGLTGADLSRTALYLNLPGGYYHETYARQLQSTVGDEAAEEVKAGLTDLQGMCQQEAFSVLARITGLAFGGHILLFGDRAGFATLLHDAAQRLKTGQFDRCILGAVDSRVDSGHLEVVAGLGFLKDLDQQHAPIPGEAAAFVSLETVAGARARGAPIQALVEGAAQVQDPVHRWSGDTSVGAGLTQVVEGTLRSLADGGAETGLIVGDQNGDPFRGVDWGHALVRLVSRFPVLRDLPTWYPAASFGDIGAASGAVAICMVVRAFARGYAGTNNVLVWLSSDDGTKSSFYLRNPARA